MLIDVKFKSKEDIKLAIIASGRYNMDDTTDLNKQNKEILDILATHYLFDEKRLHKGIYEVTGGFDFGDYLRDILHQKIEEFWFMGSRGTFGTCDNYEQVLQEYPELTSDNNKYVVVLNKVRKEDQPKEGGWRWHKFGIYIGDKNPQREYIADEPEIEEVFCYRIYKILD